MVLGYIIYGGFNMKWLGRDGKWYEDVNDCVAANSRYEQQEKQNALIASQNLLMQKHMQDQELREIERKNSERSLAKENRLNKLFDDIGISKKEFIKFEENYLSIYTIIDPYCEEKDELEKELYELKNKSNISSDIIFKIVKNNKLTFGDIYALDKSGITDGFTLYRFIRGWCYTWWIFLLIMPICFIGSELSPDSGIPLLIILSISIVPYFVYGKVKNDAINKIKKYTNKGSKKKNQIKTLEEKISNINKELEQEYMTNREKILNNYNEFTLFRRQHYNSSFEKLLLDLDIDEAYKKYDIEFVKVNNNNKVSDGTIEDYISFIEQKID